MTKRVRASQPDMIRPLSGCWSFQSAPLGSLSIACGRLVAYVAAGGTLSSDQMRSIQDAIQILDEALAAAIDDGGLNRILPRRDK